MKLFNFYATLGVGQKADDAAIKQAYRKLIRKHHPDKGGDAEVFRSIQQAYEVLSVPQKRAEYDKLGHEFYVKSNSGAAAEQGEQAAGVFSSDDLGEVFSNLFGGGLGTKQGASMQSEAIKA